MYLTKEWEKKSFEKMNIEREVWKSSLNKGMEKRKLKEESDKHIWKNIWKWNVQEELKKEIRKKEISKRSITDESRKKSGLNKEWEREIWIGCWRINYVVWYIQYMYVRYFYSDEEWLLKIYGVVFRMMFQLQTVCM